MNYFVHKYILTTHMYVSVSRIYKRKTTVHTHVCHNVTCTYVCTREDTHTHLNIEEVDLSEIPKSLGLTQLTVLSEI